MLPFVIDLLFMLCPLQNLSKTGNILASVDLALSQLTALGNLIKKIGLSS